VDARTGLPVVGMVGAGQLARMTHQAAIALGQSLRILADSAEDGAALVAGDVVVGDYRNLDDLRRFATGCDVVTWDHEHVPNEHIAALAADGVVVHPVADLGIACPRWRRVESAGELDEFAALVGWPLVLKAARGGYDGKGVWIVANALDAAAVLASGTALIAEEKAPIARELAAVIARSPWGQGAAWPVVETVQQDGICVQVIAPAPGLDENRADEAQRLALRLADDLDVTGVLAVELFETTFEQHLRAVLDYPLGTTTPTAPFVVMANLLGGPDGVVPKGIDERVHHCMARWPDVKIHLYGKSFRPGRKVGHVTALGASLDDVRARAAAAADYLANGDRA
jgi:5-(carboxyamino)imidazole ribonucleotide synthase